MPGVGPQITFRRRRRKRQSALRLAKANRRMLLNSNENKYIDVRATMQPLSAGSIIPLSQVAVGDTQNNRIANKINVNRVQVNIIDTNPGTTLIHRVIIFKDMDQAGTPPTIAELIQSANTYDFRTETNLKRFVVLRDYFNVADMNIGSVTAHKTLRFDIKRKFNVWYIGDAQADASCGKGTIYLFIMTLANGGADSLLYSTRVTFTD